MQLYKFQEQAIAELQKPDKHICIAGTGCFTGDTMVRVNSAKTGRQMTLKAFYQSWHGTNIHSRSALKNGGEVYIRGWRNGKVGLNKVKDVFCLGRKPIIRLEFSDGTVIRCTPDHKFMAHTPGSRNHKEPDWIEAKDLLGCLVAKDNPHTKRTSARKKMHDTMFRVPDGHPYARTIHPSGGKPFKSIEFHRAVYEANLNGFDDVYDWRDCIGSIGMQYVDPKKYHIHHKDHNHYNNDPDNLEAVLAKEHLRHHSAPQNFHQGEVEFIRCVEIEECGEETVYDVSCSDVHSYTANDFVVHNCGKGSIMLHWLMNTRKKKWLVVTTASKRDSHDVENEAVEWFGKKSLSSISLEVISWAGLAKWVTANWNSLDDYAFAFDELHSAKAGVSSNRGRAFLQVAKQTDCWTGYTATPGDCWMDFQAYFIAGGWLKNKTQFMREFCDVQTYKGFPEIVGYRDEHLLKRYWAHLTVCPDTAQMQAELPEERHRTIHFEPSVSYTHFLRDRIGADGELVETTMGYCHRLRQLCLTPEKLRWVADYLGGLGTNAVFFYNYVEEGEHLERVAKKALPKGAKIWRIDGKHHNIPTRETIGKYDVVLAQYSSGSASLNLQFINQWVSVSPNYSYTISIQARGRIKRIGQKKNMEFWYLLCDGTIEDDVYRCLRGKSDFSEEVWMLKEEHGKTV